MITQREKELILGMVRALANSEAIKVMAEAGVVRKLPDGGISSRGWVGETPPTDLDRAYQAERALALRQRYEALEAYLDHLMWPDSK